MRPISRLIRTLPAFMGAVALLGLTPLQPAQARSDIRVIRDTEIEQILTHWAEPLVRAADLNPNSVRIVLVESPDINAFVAGGPNIFIFTGLIDKTETPQELMGVIAHELGHISGGHLIRLQEAAQRASYEALLGTVLGLGAAIASGEGGAMPTLSAASRSMAERGFLSHSRVQESSADQAALRFMKASNTDSSGLVTFMEKLESQELLPADQQDAYVRTHPLTTDRADALRNQASPPGPVPESLAAEHARMRAKLLAFISPERVAWTYSENDQSFPARYARAIAAYRQNRTQKALDGVAALLKDAPKDPYLQELKGQILLESGRPDEAVSPLKTAVALAPDAALIRVMYAHALLESRSSGKAQITEATGQLKRALNREPRMSTIHRLLATGYGRLGNEPVARLHLAEEAWLQRRIKDAKQLAKGARDSLPAGSPERLQAEDLLSALESASTGKDREDGE